MTAKKYNEEELRKIAAAMRAADHKMIFGKWEAYKPSQKHMEFFALGAKYPEYCLFAGNRCGKSWAEGFEVACHAMGLYPDWWPGYKILDKAPTIWVCGLSAEKVRDVQQQILFGPPGIEEFLGSGFIKKDKIILPSRSDTPSTGRGVSNVYDTIHVRHSSGGVSTIKQMFYSQGPGKFQSSEVDHIWLDEDFEKEEEQKIYGECQARTTANLGHIAVTFTPVQGASPMFERFDQDTTGRRGSVKMTIFDADHLTEAMRKEAVAKYDDHERETRLYGVPMMGEGRVFSFKEEDISTPPIPFNEIPLHWYKWWAIDFGINHPFAGVLFCWDKDRDVIYVVDAFRMKDASILEIAARIKSVCVLAPIMWPHDGSKREFSSDGHSVAEMFRKQGLKMWSTHATFPDGGYDTEAGILEMKNWFGQKKLKVFSTLKDWFEEYRFYHYKDGKLVKNKDDLLSATRIGLIARRHSKQVPFGSRKPDARMNGGVILPDDPWQS